MRMWVEQLQRVERYYARVQDIVNRATEPLDGPHHLEPWYDDLLTFFLHCYHLKDWLAHDDRYKACSVCQQCRGPKPCSDSDCQMQSWLDSIAFKPPKPCRGPNPLVQSVISSQ